MKIETVIGIDDYSLLVSHCSGNLYLLSIIEQGIVVHNFEGIYPTLQTAIERGKSVIQTLKSLKKNVSRYR